MLTLERFVVAAGMVAIVSPSGPCSGWEARGVALHCLLECFPHPNSPDYVPTDDKEIFREVVHHANDGLLHFANALSGVNNGGAADSDLVLSAVLRVCGNLRRYELLPEYGAVVGFPPPQFMDAVRRYMLLWEGQETDRLSRRPLFDQLRYRAMQEQVDAYRRGDRQQVSASVKSVCCVGLTSLPY